MPQVSSILGLDVGSTFIKTARLADGTLERETFQRTRMPDFISEKYAGSKWLAPNMLIETLDSALMQDSTKFGKPERIYVSGQMHGATLCHIDSVLPLVPISTWQDTAARDFQDGGRWLEVTEALTPMTRAVTGNELDLGHPIVVLPFLVAQLGRPPESVRFTSLISLIVEHLVRHPVTSHISDAAASGMYDPFNETWVPELLELAQIENAVLPETDPNVVIAGYTIDDEIPVHLGVGDHQASLFGGESVDQDPATEIAINVGTGAQVSSVSPKPGGAHRLRPKLGGGFFATVADLPAGRELSNDTVTFTQAAQAYVEAAETIHSGSIESVALTGSIFSSAPEFAAVIGETFGAPTRITEGEPALSGLARLAD